MDQQITLSPKHLQQLTISKVNNLSVRAKTMPALWQSPEPTFAAIRKHGNAKLAKQVLIVEIGKMVDLLKADMQSQHILFIVDYILQHYYSYTISDLTVLTDRLVKNNPYGKPIMQNIIHELDQYSIEKQEFAVLQRQKENSQHKQNTIANDKILRIYDNMKAEARKPKPTQKEKDKAAKQLNNEKIKELAMLYPQSK
jgi:hypothetical protein